MFDNLKADTRRLRATKSKSFPWYVLESLLFDNGYQAVVLYRIAHWFKSRRVPFFGPAVARLSLFLTGVEIGSGAVIGPGLMISHGVGIVVGGEARIGAQALLLHQVTIGAPSVRRRGEMPVIGDGVFIGAGSRVIGGIRIGDDVFIGTNTVVAQDIADGCKVTSEAPLIVTPPEENQAADDEESSG